MSVPDGVLAAGIVLLLLVVLGVMRETVILRGQVTALSQLIIRPPVPSFLGKRLPPALATLVDALAARQRAFDPSHQPHVIVFLSSGCQGCDHLVAELREEVAVGHIEVKRFTCVVSGASKDAPILRAVQEFGASAVFDADGSLFTAGEVRGAPTQLAIWADTMEVFDHKLGGDVAWLRQKLQPELSTLSRGAVPLGSAQSKRLSLLRERPVGASSNGLDV